MQKDRLLRQKFSRQEVNQKVVIYLFRQMLNKSSYSFKVKKQLFGLLFKKYANFTSKTKIVRRCVLTGRSRSSLRMAGISRIKIKELIRDKKISNGLKQSW